MNTDSHLLNKIFWGILITNSISVVAAIACVMIDGIITGQFLGPDAVTASGLMQPILMVINLIGGVMGGVNIMCAAYLGKARRDRVNQVFSITVIALFILSVIMLMIVFFLAPWFAQALAGKTGSPEIEKMIVDYLRGFCIGMLFMRFAILFSGIMMLDNDKNRAMSSMVATLIADVIFDLANVLVFHGGMFGMAVATSLSYVVGFLVIMPHFRRKDRVIHFTVKGLRPGDLVDVALRGIPHVINMGSQAIRIFCYNTLLLAIADKTAVAGLSICNNAFSVLFALLLGMFMSVSVLSSLLYHEEDKNGLGKGLGLAVKLTLGIFTVVALLVIIFPQWIACLFVNPSETDTVLSAAGFIRFWGIQFMFTALCFPVSATYQGTGKLRLNYLLDISREAVLPIACVVGFGSAFGVRGAQIGFAVAGFLTFALCFIIPTVCNKKFPTAIKDFLVFDEGFGAKADEMYETTIHNMDEVIAASEEVKKLCLSKGAEGRKAYMLALFVEEMAGNTVLYGYPEGERANIDLRFVFHGDSGVIRLRDDGKPFDPVRWLDQNSSEDPTSGLGIRAVTGLAKDVRYTPSMEMNSLVITL